MCQGRFYRHNEIRAGWYPIAPGDESVWIENEREREERIEEETRAENQEEYIEQEIENEVDKEDK